MLFNPAMILALLLFQSAALPPPDIEIGASVRARSLTVEKSGEARLAVTTSPEGENIVEIEAPKGSGKRTIRNARIDVKAEARIADPLQPSVSVEAGAEPE